MRRSPLSESRLARGPGDSLIRMLLERHMLDAMLGIVGSVFTGSMFIGAFVVWLGGRLSPTGSTQVILIVSGLFFAIMALRTWINWPKWTRAADNLHKGRAGEQAAAAVLAELGKDGYIIVHDIPLKALDPTQPEGPNIDHLLIGPAGVFVVETKYIAKSRGNGKPNEVTYDPDAEGGRGRLLFNGLPKDRCALEQVRRNCKTVDVFVRSKQPGFVVPIRPMVFVLGWMVHVPPTLDVAVINPKRIFTLVRSLPVALQKQQIGSLYESLSPALTREDTTADMFDDPAV